MQCLRVKGFCVIGDAINEQLLSDTSRDIDAANWYRPALLVQDGLLGPEGSARVARLPSVDFAKSGSTTYDGVTGIDYTMWKLVEAIGPYQEDLGLRCSGRSVGFLHQATDPDMDEVDLTDEEASEWCSLFTCRKIMVMVILGPEAGTLEMQPYDDECNSAEITCVPGMMVVLRTDQLAFKFYSQRQTTYVATAFMLQSDVLRMHRNKLEEHLTPPARELDNWIESRLKEIKEQEPDEVDFNNTSGVPRNFIHAANRTWFKRQTTAVRGAAARHPVTWEPEVFFLGLIAGSDTVIEVPFLRWDHSTIYDASETAWQQFPPKTNCRHASFVDGVDLFDNKVFGLSLAEVKGMDPGQRLVLEVTYDALHRSGMKKSTLINSTCGMYVGTSNSEWNMAERSADVGIYGATGGAPSITAGRLSFCLGCKGASLAVDTEAASGLSSVFWACESVEKKGSGFIQDLACAIGVHLCLAKAWWPAHSAAGFLSPAGRCFTFDSSARGHVRSEAVGTVVVRCRDLLVDGEEVSDDSLPLVGTIVGGSTSNSGRSANMTAPSGPAEQANLIEACRKSGIMPFDVDVIECHGSGRMIPDAVEVSSCAKALRNIDPASLQENPEMLQLCSMKTNTGNSIETSGISSLIKTMHSIRWGIVAPNTHLRQLNPHIDIHNHPSLLMGVEPCEQRNSAVFAGVSSYGFGGTNVHIHCYGGVDEEMRPPPEPTSSEFRPRLSFWPGGGGDLGSMNRPKRGFFIIGTWTNWSEVEQMEEEGDGVFGYTLTLGANRWEQFQLLIDGTDNKILHPQKFQAPKGTEVFGPVKLDEVKRNSTWYLDAREKDSSRAIADSTGTAIVPSSGTAISRAITPVPKNAEDVGLPGQQYRVRLHIAGKWRTVTWSKLDA